MRALALLVVCFVAFGVTQCIPNATCYPAYFTGYNPCDTYTCDSNSTCVRSGAAPDTTPCDLADKPCRQATCVAGTCTETGLDKPVDSTCQPAPPNGNRDCSTGVCTLVSGTLSCQTSAPVSIREGESCNKFDNCTIDTTCQAGQCVGTVRDCFPYIQRVYQNGSLFVEDCWQNTECKTISPTYNGDRCQELIVSSIPNCNAANLPPNTLCLQPFNPQNPSPCDDGNNCTTSDQCGGGRCLSLVRNCSTDAQLFSKFWITEEKDRSCYDSFSQDAECRYLNGTCYLPFTEERSICDDKTNTTNYDVCITGVCNSWYYESSSIWVYFNLTEADSIVTFNSKYFLQIDQVGRAIASALQFPYASTVKPTQVWPSETGVGAYVRYIIFDLDTNTTDVANGFTGTARDLIGTGLVETITLSRLARLEAPPAPSSGGIASLDQTPTIVGVMVAFAIMLIVIGACFLYYGTKAVKGGKYGSTQTASTASTVSSASSAG